MKDAAAMRAEIGHLRTLGAGTTDSKALAVINQMIHELELQLHRGENGAAG